MTLNEKDSLDLCQFVNCSESDVIEGCRLDQIVGKAISSMDIRFNKDMDAGQFYEYCCNQMEKKIGGGGEPFMISQHFCDEKEFIHNVDDLAGIVLAKKIIDVLSLALAQVKHIKETNGMSHM